MSSHIWVIRTRKSKDRQYKGQEKKNKGSNNDLQNITQEIKDWATQTPLKPGVNIGDLEAAKYI
jgi:hypothetical protein